MLTWLHLSDLHLCSAKTGWDADRMLKSLLADLSAMEQKHDLCPDLLLVSGDLAFGHLGEGDLSIQSQFGEVALFLEEVRAAFSRPIPSERVFLVPGNHDVDRGKILASQTRHLDDLAAGDYARSCKTVNEMLRDARGEWPKLMERLDAYKAFLHEYYPHLLTDEQRLCYARTLEIDGSRLGIAGLNSAWSSGRDQEKGKLWLGGEWQFHTLRKQLQGADLTLALIHHPLTWLVAQENPALDPKVQKDFDFFVHGHEHQAWVEQKKQHIRLAAGACYGEISAESGYSLVRLHPQDGRGEVWLRRFGDEGLGWIPRVISGRTDDHGRWPLAWLTSKAEPEAASAMPAPPDQADARKNEASAAVPAPDSPESRGVYGRAKDIAKLARQLQDKPILLLHGMTGIGKSWLIEEIHRARPGGVEYKLVEIRATPHLSADEIFQQLAAVLQCFDENPKAPRDPLHRLEMEKLAQYRAAKPCIVHIYRTHKAFDDSGFIDIEVRTFLRGLVKHLPQFRIILESTRAAPEELFPAKEYSVYRVKGLNPEAVQAFFRRPFSVRPQQGWTLDEEQAREVYERLGGKKPKIGAHPLGMMLLAGVADGMGNDPRQVLLRHSDKLYKELEKNLFSDLYEQVFTPSQQHMLRLCALYRQDIPYQHEAVLNRRVGDDGAFDALVQRFMLSSDERQERYDLHSLFADLTRQRIKPGSADYQGDHAVIAEEWLRPVRGVVKGKLPHILAANEAAYHLLEAQEFERLRDLSHTLLGRDTPAALEAWSDRLHEREDVENRRYVLELLVALEPDNHKARRFLGECIEKVEGHGADKALEHYLKAHELLPDYPKYLANIGRCLLARREAGHFVTLVDGLNDYVRERAVNAFVQDIYSRCLEGMGQGDKASQQRQQLIREGIRNAPIYNDEAVYLYKQKNYAEALAVLDKAERAGVMNEYLWAVKAGILQDSGQGEQASRLRRAQIEAGVRNPVFYNDEALYQWHQQNDPAVALAVLEQAEQAGCADDHTLAIKAKLLENLGRGEEASRLRRARIDAGVRHAALYNDEAVYLREQDDYEGALAVLELAEHNRSTDEITPNIRRGIEQHIRQAEATQPPKSPVPNAARVLDRGPHTILVLAANPFLDLRLDEEIRAIQNGLDRARQRDKFRFIHHPATRPEDWRRALLDLRPAIVQFSGHGKQGEGILLQQGADGQARAVSAAALGNLFALFKDKVLCVLLNACYSEPQARAIARHIPYVAGMNSEISDEAARAFSTAFYDALGAGEDFEFAYRMGCNALDFLGLPAAQTPVFFKDGALC
ncbi:MAG: hypothetical protein GY862_27830 [Gammaproteobacteria bacterium]|nr:hypothetical protein [Gammaproteobacteria bacterium]